MTHERTHKEIHKELHNKLDELLSDFMNHTGKEIDGTTVEDLIRWSFDQTINPTEKSDKGRIE